MAKDPVEIVKTVEGIWDSGKLDELDGFFAPDFQNPSGVPGLPPGLEGAKMAHQMAMQSFPDRKTEIQDIVGSGNKVALRMHVTGTNKGGVPWIGAPANGSKVDFEWMSFYEVNNGKITKHWGVNDGVMLMIQTGAWSPPQM